jgi:hypothetical protein
MRAMEKVCQVEEGGSLGDCGFLSARTQVIDQKSIVELKANFGNPIFSIR